MSARADEPEMDPLSTASVGLVALGLDKVQRADTLSLLAALLDLVDPRGEVLLDESLLAVEERLGIDLCLDAYERLERLGVIARTWSGWSIPSAAAHRGPAGATQASMAVLRQHMQAMTEESRSTKPVEATAPVVRLRPWRRRVPIALASVAAGVAAVAGASQFVPQAAVSTHNVANQTNATLTSRLPQVGTSSPLPTGQTLPGVDTTTQSTTEQSTTTTTTSTTLLPPIPCLTDGSGRVVTPTLPRRVDALPDILHCP